MDRRTFMTMLAAAGAVRPMLQRPVQAAATQVPKARNVVLVHGLFADGSCWSEVIARLQAAGLNVTAVQNPLTTLHRRWLRRSASWRGRTARRFWWAIPLPA